MKIAHVGPPRARLGGPAGYLWELARVATPDPRFSVTFPPEAPPRPASAPPSFWDRSRAVLGPFKRRLLGAPEFSRPQLADLVRPFGPAAELLVRAFDEVSAEVAPSRIQALAEADVLFAHDPWTATQLVEQSSPDQKVWLFVHAPFPLSLYLVWSWARPELPWELIAELHDVRTFTERELATYAIVDRLILPCREAGDEFLRIDSRFAEPLATAEFLLTGAAGPERKFSCENRRALRKRFGIPFDQPVGLFLGNPQPYRGLDALVAALSRLVPGRGVVAVAGPARETLLSHPRLVRLGRVAAVADLLAAVDFVINVNRFSLFDLSTVEALAAGRPLLLHATGGNRTFEALGAGCRSFTGLEPAKIARELDAMFALAPEELARLGAASLRCWSEHLTPEHWWARHAELYCRTPPDRSGLDS